MKNIFLFLFFLPILAKSQDEKSFKFVYSRYEIDVPLEEGKITFTKIEEFDSTLNGEKIFSQIKPSISKLFVKPTVANQYNLFQFQNIKEQIIYEDKENRTLEANIIFKTSKDKNEKNSPIKEDVIVVCKGKFIVRNNKLKIIISDVSFYYTSLGAAILVGAQNSLIESRLDDLYNKRKKGDSTVITNNSDFGKAYYSTLVKTEQVFNYIREEIKKNLNQENF